MKSNQKGFTLIELLAVIVILAIIALITTPIVLNVIAGARDDAAKNKMYGIVDAVRLAYTQNQITDSPETGSGGIITITFPATTLGSTPISMSGDKPTGGKIYIDINTGKIYTGTKSGSNDYRVQFSDGYKCEVPSADSGSGTSRKEAGKAYCSKS